jgi:hypothetical protein
LSDKYYSNATGLIEKFWEEKKSKKKSAEKPKRGRKSAATDRDASVSVSSKKRVRKSETARDSEDIEMAEVNGRKGGAKKVKRDRSSESERPDFGSVMGNMDQHMNEQSWEELVATIDTVEMEEGNQLWIYFKT